MGLVVVIDIYLDCVTSPFVLDKNSRVIVGLAALIASLHTQEQPAREYLLRLG